MTSTSHSSEGVLPAPARVEGREVIIAGRRIGLGGPRPELREGEKLVAYTTSPCPHCYRLLPAIIFERDGAIWIRKKCPEHGEMEEVYYEDADMYYRFMKYEEEGKGVKPYVQLAAPCPYNCGLCPLHKNHTALANLVVTNRCNLSCWYCLPRDQEVLVRINGRTMIISVEELAGRYAFPHKVEINGFRGEYVVPQELEILGYQDRRITWVRVSKFLRRKHRGPIYIIRTRTGRVIKTTPEHKFAVFKEGKLVRKEAGKLQRGDRLLVAARIPVLREGHLREINLSEAFRALPPSELGELHMHSALLGVTEGLGKGRGGEAHHFKLEGAPPLRVLRGAEGKAQTTLMLSLKAVQHRIPTALRVTGELARLIGYFVASGHYTSRDIRITAGDEEVLRELISIAERLSLPHSIILEKGKAPQIAIGDRLLRLVFKHVFRIPGEDSGKRLPRQIHDFPLEAKLELLNALFNSNGFVIREKHALMLVYTTISEGLARDIAYLLESLGVFPRIHKVSKEKMLGAKHDLHKVIVSGKELEKMAPLLRLKRHGGKLEEALEHKPDRLVRHGDYVVDEIEEIHVEHYEGYVYDFEVDSPSHVFVAGDGVLVSNCFFYSEAAGYVYEPSLEQIRFMVRQLKKQGVTMAVQITGGEPTLREDLVDIVRLLKEEGVRHIQLNTQGIRIAEMYLRDPQLAVDYVSKLRAAGVNTLYLSFDGVSPRVNWKNHWEIPFMFDAFRKGNMTSIVLVPTVIKGINDHELGAIIKFAGKHIDIVRGVNYQPVSLTGMMKRHERLKLRITIPGAIKKIEEQTDGQIYRDAWYPIPVSTVFSKFIEALTNEPQFTMANHPACGAATYVFVERGENGVPKRFIPISDFLDVEGFVEYLKEKTEELEEGKNKYLVLSKMFINMKKFVDSSRIPKNLGLTKMLFKVFVKRSYSALGELHYKMLFLGMMHFMDLYNYDVERVMRCNIHYLMPDGRIVPFCAFNVLNDIYRDYVQEKYKVPIEEWAAKHGEKSVGIASKYKRNRKLMETHPLYRETYKGILF